MVEFHCKVNSNLLEMGKGKVSTAKQQGKEPSKVTGKIHGQKNQKNLKPLPKPSNSCKRNVPDDDSSSEADATTQQTQRKHKKNKKNQDTNSEEVEIAPDKEVIMQGSNAEGTEADEENNQVCCINWQCKKTHS